MNYIDAINKAEKLAKKYDRNRIIICLNEDDDKLVRTELCNRGYRWISGADLMKKTFFNTCNISSYIVQLESLNVCREDEKYYVEPYQKNPNYFVENRRFIVVNNRIALPDEDSFLKLLSQS